MFEYVFGEHFVQCINIFKGESLKLNVLTTFMEANWKHKESVVFLCINLKMSLNFSLIVFFLLTKLLQLTV